MKVTGAKRVLQREVGLVGSKGVLEDEYDSGGGEASW